MLDVQGRETVAQLATIGYEGTRIAEFIIRLQAGSIRLVIDVRELPLSRKPGFSKRALGDALAEAGIGYTHFRDLGDPKPGRDAARAGDHELFRTIFTRHLKTDPAQAAIDAVVPLVAAGGACLLCFEKCHEGCHRSIVADAISERLPLSITHLG